MILSMTKSVRFAPEESLFDYHHECRRLSQAMIEQRWYQKSDFFRLINEAQESVKTAKQEGLGGCLDYNYGCTDSETQEMLNKWTSCEDTRRGLERFVSDDYCSRRLLHKRKTIYAVLYSQEKLWKENCIDSRAESIIQSVLSTLSANAVQFARMMAIADHHAVCARKQETLVTTAQRMISLPMRREVEPSRKISRTHRPASSIPQRPPRHSGPVQYDIKVSPLA